MNLFLSIVILLLASGACTRLGMWLGRRNELRRQRRLAEWSRKRFKDIRMESIKETAEKRA